MAITLPTNAETDRYNFGHTTATVIALGKPERTSDATLLGTYYFDASDAGPTDTSAGWTNDANAFNNSLSDFANSAGILGRALTGEGTTAPTSGSTIGEVVVVVSLEAAEAGGPDTIILVSEDSVGGTLLGTTTFAQWGFDLRKFGMDLTAPSGGWTWQKVNDLAISFASDSTDCNIYRAQVLVYADDASADEEYLMILATGDDDAETWTTPTGWTQFFQVNDTGGDDATIAGWYIKESSALPVTELVRGIEEGVAVMFTVAGADQTTFEDLAFSLTTPAHFVSTLNVDGTPDITPQPITTVTDDALVIILTGNRSSQPHLAKTNLPPWTWDVTAPSGYTIESDNSDSLLSTNILGAPSRLQQGAAVGDAQMTWMWKTVTTAGTETPADITGFTGARDMKTVTFAIRPAVAAAAVYPPFPRRSPTQVRM